MVIDKESDLTCKTNPLTYDKFIDDINYIKSDIITQLPNGKYMKYSKLLHAVVVLEFSENDYFRYWNTKYIRSKKETKFYKDIKEAATNKLKNGLTSINDMKQLIKSSDDTTTDKVKALKLLKRK